LNTASEMWPKQCSELLQYSPASTQPPTTQLVFYGAMLVVLCYVIIFSNIIIDREKPFPPH